MRTKQAMTDLPGVIANDGATGRLRDRLQQAFGWTNPRDVRIATAYFTPDGFEPFQSGLRHTARVRLLLGERPFLNRRGPSDVLAQPGDDGLEPGTERWDWHTFLEDECPWIMLSRDERKALIAADPDSVRGEISLTAWEKVAQLVAFLRRDGVEMRRFAGDGLQAALRKIEAGELNPLNITSPGSRLHAKTYVLSGADTQFATVGSSNLTKSGLENNVELNMTTQDAALVSQLERWFDGKWAQGVDCKQAFIDAVEDSILFGRRWTPWQIFLKSLHATYAPYLDMGLSEGVTAKLADYQQQAVQRCIGLIDRHWGALLCDSVGLGKTFEGLGILEEYTRRQDKNVRALVICPAQLESNWSPERLFANGINGTVVTMERLPRWVDLHEVDDAERRHRERELRNLQDHYDIVLVDESHNFRNQSTKRYRALMEIIRGGKKADKRVVLMTATPINNSIWDLYSQLMLITRGDDGWYAGRGSVANLRNTFQSIEQGGGGTALLDTMMLSLVRRTRHDIRAMQDQGVPMEIDGEPIRFPQHEIPKAVGYSLTNLYGNIYREVIDVIEKLNFAVYRLDEYGVDTGEPGSKESVEQVKQRNANFVGIMRTIFLKRMESSTAALQRTVDQMARYLDLFLHHLGEGKVLTPKQAQRLRAVMGGSLPDGELDSQDWDERAQASLRELREAPTQTGQRERLAQDVRSDREMLGNLLQRLTWLESMWGTEGDPKLKALRELLEGLPATDAQGVPTKVALFTNYKDTAQYLFRGLGGDDEALSKDIRVQSNLQDRRSMSLLTGGDDQKRRQRVLEHFAPLAAHRQNEPIDDPGLQEKVRPYREQGIELLIATDVLSEGQNLQDAQYLVNYDLHWNPVRMIQRAGRIDRLFSPHDKVYFYNIMPEQELEDLLKLVSRLKGKLETIEDAVALDASVLGEQIEARELDKILKLHAGGQEAEEVYREGERTQGLDAGLEVLNQYIELIKTIGTEDLEGIPDGAHSVKEGDTPGVYVLLRRRLQFGEELFWRFYPGGDTTQPMTSPSQIIEHINADKGTPRVQLPAEENPFRHLREPLAAAVHQVGDEYVRSSVDQGSNQLTRALKRILQRNDLLERDEALWGKLSEWAAHTHPPDMLTRPGMRDAARKISTIGPSGDFDVLHEALQELWRTIEAQGLDRYVEPPSDDPPSIADLELVAWELVVAKGGGTARD